MENNKRLNGQLNNIGILQKNNIPFKANKHGNHLLIEFDNIVIDFWPFSGYWKIRKHAKSVNRGVKKLLDYIAMEKEKACADSHRNS